MDKPPKKEKKPQKKLRDAICENALQYKLLFNSMTESFALSELVFDSNGKPKDYRYLEVNRSFEKFIGLQRREIVGKLRSGVPIALTQSSFKIYSQVALTGKPAQFKNYNATLDKYYIVNVYSPVKNQFATIFNDITGQERANKKIKHLASFPQMNPNPVIEIGANAEISFLNKAAKKVLVGLENKNCEKFFLPSDIANILGALKEKKPDKTYFYREVSIGGKILAEDIHISKKLNAARIYAKDITEHKLAEENLNRLNRTLKALNGINHSILRASTEKEFLDEACRIIVQNCGHKMVWVGFANNDEQKTIQPVSWSGFEKGYLKTLNLTWNNSDRGRGPTGAAIRTGETRQCKNMLTDPDFAPWRQEALKRGYASAIAVPLKSSGKIIGAITIYAKEPDPLTGDEIELLVQLADDIAYGIYTLNLRKEHAAATGKLRETSEYLDNLLSYANAPIIVWDPNLKITKFNTAFQQLTGLKAEQVLGKSLGIIFPAESKAKSMGMIRSALAGKRWEIVEIPIKRVDGKIRNVVWNSANILGGSKEVVATIAQGQDITDRKIAEEKREAAEIALKKHARELENAVRELENLHLAVENASDIIFIANPKGVILSMNSAIKNLTGYEPAEVIGKKMRILGEATDQKLYDKMWETINKDKRRFMVEIEKKNLYGKKMIFELYVSPVLNGKKEIIFLVGIVRDRTEAKEVDRAKTEFISLAAHQLRTPLSTISMASEMLANGNIGEIDEAAKTQLREICDTAHNMAGMIELFLNISRIELGRLDINPEPTNIIDFARGMEKEIAPQAELKRIALKTDFDPNLKEVNIDRKIMHIALENLLANAVKYTQKGGRIVFSMHAKNGNIIASVADNGRGIPKNELPLIFNKMFRATNVGEAKGMGLGLNMTRSAIEQCGGSVSVESKENKGSTFSIAIPLSGMKKKKIKIEQ